MLIEPIGATATGAPAAPATQKAPKQTLDSEVFLQLLVTQLTNQDPSSPMDTNAMTSQTTQLAMMEQLTTLTGTSTEAFALDMRQVATTLIGKEASYVDETGATQTGIVTRISFDGPVPQVTIGERTVALDDISGISTTTTPPAPAAA